MSMISSLIDELNKSADEWNSCNMFELARMCRDAADTIWHLRDDLQRANAENAKLREQGERLFDKTLELGTKNAKLMEACKKWMGKAAHHEAVAGKLRELLDFALPIAMYAASTEEGDRMRELMREVE